MEIIYLSFENDKHVCFCEGICTMMKDFPFLFFFERYSSNYVCHFIANAISRCEFLANNFISEMNDFFFYITTSNCINTYIDLK